MCILPAVYCAMIDVTAIELWFRRSMLGAVLSMKQIGGHCTVGLIRTFCRPESPDNLANALHSVELVREQERLFQISVQLLDGFGICL